MREMETQTAPLAAVERLRDAINGHDLDVMVSCFASDYVGEFPAHPNRVARGPDGERRNWAQIFASAPDLRADLLNTSTDGERVWAEWEWKGTRRDGLPFLMRGVTVQAARQGQLVWARLYMEPVEEGAGSETAIREQLAGEART